MIIGITGTNGSGKGTVVEYLVSKGFKHFSARDFIVAEIERRGIPVNRSAMRETANDLRKQHGPTYIIEMLYAEAEKAGGDALIESVREVAGAKFLKERGAFLLATDADRHTRYERIVGRDSSTDKVSFEEFCEQEDREMNAPDAWDMSVAGVMALAEHTVRNDGSIEELRAQVDAILEQLAR